MYKNDEDENLLHIIFIVASLIFLISKIIGCPSLQTSLSVI